MALPRRLFRKALLSLLVAHILQAATSAAPDPPEQTPPILRFRDYLRIRTDHPVPAYSEAIAFLNATTSALLPSATFATHEFFPGKPVAIVTIQGTHPDLPSLMLNSHTDVVPAEPEKWDLPPFDARVVYRDDEWRMYARGSQDMKCVGMQYLEAAAALTKRGWQPERTVHITFVPDEEIGGQTGMGQLVNSPVFAQLNVGVSLDEGLPNPESKFHIYYGERQTWWLVVSVKGNPGHGGSFPEHTAAQTLHAITARALAFRESQFARLQSGVDIGEVIGVNIVYTKAGTENPNQKAGHVMNMVPTIAEAGFDIRVPPTVSAEDMDAEIASWLTCEGSPCEGASFYFANRVEIPVVTSRDSAQNAYIDAFNLGLQKAGVADRLQHGLFFAATDARFLRDKGIPCFGFSPIENTPRLLHKHNEYLSLDSYVRGCRIYEPIIEQLAGVPEGKSEVAEVVAMDETDGKEDL